MSKIKSPITKQSYMLKRLRDSGYRAEKLIGNTDAKSLEIDFEKFIDKVFPNHKPFYNSDIKTILKEHKRDLVRYTYLCQNYAQHDSRVWTILIDSGRDNIFLTFVKNSKDMEEEYENLGGDYFEIYDGDQYIKPIRKKLNTHSYEVIIQELNAFGILKKFDN